jgi:hypothetical protein
VGGNGSSEAEGEGLYAGLTVEDLAQRRKVADARIEDYRSLLDSAYEMLSPIMSHETIRTMPYKELIYELERRRQWMEANKKYAEEQEMKKQMTGKQNKSQNNQ